jgi:hypothetical protein
MKRTLLALALFALFLPAARNASAGDVSIDFFYNNLGGGSWVEVGDYGYGWQPEIAVSNRDWRPYADGYWAYTDVGWTWVSYEDFGWATYHYGRWSRVADYGWVWFPGSDLEWGPAWVSWRTGGDYIGWAPLPPRGVGIVYEGRPIGGQVDIEFDIGPTYYNFVDVRYIGEPVLRDRIFAPSQNVTYINQTVNVTNITYTNNTVYNYGPDYNALSAQSSRPIQRLSLERQQNVDAAAAVKSGAITKVQGNKLVVAAPLKIQKPATQIAPPAVKTKVAASKIDRGWTGVANEAELKQKIKTENPKQIPPPTRAKAAGAAGAQASPVTSASPATSAAAATAASPVERGKGKGKGAQRGQPAAAASPALSAAPALTSPSPAVSGKEGKEKRGRGRPGEQPGAGAAAGAATTAPAAISPSEAKHKGRPERTMPNESPSQPGAQPNQGAPGKHKGGPPASATPFSGAGQNMEQRGPARESKGLNQSETLNSSVSKKKDDTDQGAISKIGRATSPSPGAGQNVERPGGKHKGTAEGVQSPAAGHEQGPAAQRGPATERGPGTQRGPAAVERAPATERGPGGPHGKPEGGKKKGEASPTPSP